MPSQAKSPEKFTQNRKEHYNQYANYHDEEPVNKAKKQSDYRRKSRQMTLPHQWH